MISEKQIGYVKEFLERLSQTDADRADAKEIVETLRALHRVLNISKMMVSRPPAVYSPNSRKFQLQDAIKPFMKPPSDELHDRSVH